MASQEIPIGTIRDRLTELLADWGGDVSVLLQELEAKRAQLEELEANSADQSAQVGALNKRIETQDTLIDTLHADADQTETLRGRLHSKDVELEKKTSEIESKHELIGALRRTAEGVGQLKGDSKAKDKKIARLTREKEQAVQHAAELTEEFKILTASTLTGIDTTAELEAVRAELDARKSLIESLRGDAERAQALEDQLEQKRFVISTLETSIDRHASTISELQQSVSTWKGQYAALMSSDPAAKPASAAALPELTDEALQAEESAEDVSGGLKDPTAPINMRKPLQAAQQTARAKK